jgi:hypothetical protein
VILSHIALFQGGLDNLCDFSMGDAMSFETRSCRLLHVWCE